jgi:hypothetical protein
MHYLNIGLLSLLLFSCSQKNINQKSLMMHDANSSFFEIPLNSDEKTTCSPAEKESNWLGILINAPLSIEKSRLIFPVCGYYRLNLTSIINSDPLTIKVRHIETNTEYSGVMVDIDDNPEAPAPIIEATEEDVGNYDNTILGSYFNPNILDYVDMPFIGGRYQVVIEYGNQQSNTVYVSIHE